jgi:hypothetical protein
VIVQLVMADGSLRPLVLDGVAAVVVRQNNTTPIMVAAEVGDGRSQEVAHCKDKNFNHVLRQLGINQMVICDTLTLAKPPPGARLVAGPGVQPGDRDG